MNKFFVNVYDNSNKDDLINELNKKSIPFKEMKSLKGFFCIWLKNDQNIDTKVKNISKNDYSKITTVQRIDRNNDNWGLARIDKRRLPIFNNGLGEYDYTNKGINVDVYVIDTGIRYTHEDFKNRVTRLFDSNEPNTKIIGSRFNLTSSGVIIINNTSILIENNSTINDVVQKISSSNIGNITVSQNNGAIELKLGQPLPEGAITISGDQNILNDLGLNNGTFENNNPNWANDKNGHGSHVSGIAGGFKFGVAKKINLYSLAAFDQNGDSNLEKTLDALDATLTHHNSKTTNKPSIVNASWTFFSINGLVENAIQELIDNGIVFVTAAGNFGGDAGNFSPARMEDAITVGSINISDSISSFSNISSLNQNNNNSITNTGKSVNVFAPGQDILSVWKDSDNSTQKISGTSMSTPFVVGVCATYLQNKSKFTTKSEVLNVKNFIIDNSTKDEIKNVNSDTENRILYSVFTSGEIIWETESGSFGKFNQKTSISIQLSAFFRTNSNDNEDVNFELVSGFLPDGISLSSNGLISGTLPSVPTNNDFNFVVKAFNNDFENLREFSFTILTTNTPPEWITPVGNLGVFDEKENINLQLQAIDEENNVIFSLHNGSLPPGINLDNNGLISGKISDIDEDTTYTFTIRISDNSLVSDRTFNIVVNNINSPPVWKTEKELLKNSENNNPTQNSFFSFQLEASDFDNDKITFSVESGVLPQGLELNENTGLISGIITDNSGIFNFTLGINDNINDIVLKDFSIRVLNITGNIPPEWITPSGNLGVFDENKFITIPLEVFDRENDALTFSLGDEIIVKDTEVNGLPNGLEISSDGVITGTVPLNTVPQNFKQQTFIFNIKVEDDKFNVSQRKFSIKINEIGENKKPFWITEQFLGNIYENEKVTFKLEARDPEEKQIFYSLIPGGLLPKGIKLNSATGDLEGTIPPHDEDFTYKFPVEASDGEKSESKIFIFKVLNKFSGNIWDINVDLTGDQKIDWVNYTIKNINLEYIYRLNDKNFGIVTEPQLKLIEGINLFPENSNNNNLVASFETLFDDGNTLFDNGDLRFDVEENVDASDVLIKNIKNHHQKNNVMVGNLTYAVARDNNKKPIYELIYRPVIDKKSGFIVPYQQNNPIQLTFDVNGKEYELSSFVSKFEIAVYIDGKQLDFTKYNIDKTKLILDEEPSNKSKIVVFFVITPRFEDSKINDNFNYLTPATINNMRKELINEMGLSAPELLPKWMTSEQEENNNNSILGYTPVIPVVYVLPGSSKKILNTIENDLFNGCIFTIDRFHITSKILDAENKRTRFDVFDQTLFDENTTQFDDNETLFDLFMETLFDDDTTQFDVKDSEIKNIDKYMKFPLECDKGVN